MNHYYVKKSAHAKGQHEVHLAVCAFMLGEKNRNCLGLFKNCAETVQEARKFYPRSDLCFSVQEKRTRA